MARHKFTPAVQDTAYKGYLIRFSTFGNTIFIEKDGKHISYATSLDDARNIIDQLAFGNDARI